MTLTERFELTFPEEEAHFLMKNYASADVILEYGSGGSTVLAAKMANKYVVSVESDKQWAISLQKHIDASRYDTRSIVYYSDIGPTGAWGRPLDETHWRKFSTYSTHVWAQPFFRQPDVVLIDGRLRAASFVATCLRVKKPTKILFDDYTNREAYHIVEKIAKPISICGRMAEFLVEPTEYPIWVHDLFNALLGDIACETQENFLYPDSHEKTYPFQ